MRTLAAIVGVVIMVVTALIMGHDGAILMSGLAIVAGLGGYVYGKKANDSETGQVLREEAPEQIGGKV